ncbi:MAG: DUF4434 domain-containing protein [Candidatus Riflebacteria bacterium]|nr:DUF4434 domain-containing protein [Candidatus Riflebacteria bacterium]
MIEKIGVLLKLEGEKIMDFLQIFRMFTHSSIRNSILITVVQPFTNRYLLILREIFMLRKLQISFPFIFFLFLFLGSISLFSGPFDDNNLSGNPTNISAENANPSGEIPTVENSVILKPESQRITGGFFQFWGSDNDKDESDWLKELSAMRDIGMDTVIIQSNQSSGTNFSKATEILLGVADKIGMKVFIGTALNEDGWYLNGFNPWYISSQGNCVADYTKILVKQFSPHKSFVGLYIPYEENSLASAVLIGEFYGKISQAAKSVKPDLKVLISPYTAVVPKFPVSMPSGHLKKFFETLFDRAGVDICALQDGVGCSSGRLNKISSDLKAVSEACQDKGVEFWVNVEIFEAYKDKETNSSGFRSGNIERISKQISSEGSFGKKIICFDFNHYLSPNSGNELAIKLYGDYQKYLQSN